MIPTCFITICVIICIKKAKQVTCGRNRSDGFGWQRFRKLPILNAFRRSAGEPEGTQLGYDFCQVRDKFELRPQIRTRITDLVYLYNKNRTFFFGGGTTIIIIRPFVMFLKLHK